MSEPATRTGRGRADALLAALALALVVGALWFLSGAEERSLRRSATGFDGLAAWLRTQGTPARAHTGFPPLEPAGVGLRVLPLYDADLDASRTRATTREALIARESEVDIAAAVVREKIRLLPTLVVLPKWRSGMRLAGRAHPSLLIDAGALDGVLAALAPGLGRVRRGAGADARIAAPEGEASLYVPQTVADSACRPVLGERRAMLLGECRLRDGGARFWLLSDPDLMNNHGLARGDNAAVAAGLVAALAAGTVVVDYTTEVWATRERAAGRNWADLLGFLAWPFTPFWAALAAFAALLLWSGSVRRAPAVDDADPGPGASGALAIAAKARLLRAAGHDTALLGAWIESRLDAAAAALGERRGGRPEDALAARLERDDPEAAARLRARVAETRAALASPHPAPAALIEHVRAIDALLPRTSP